MLVELLDEPSDFVSQIQRYTYSVTHQMIVGHRAITKHEPTMKEFYSLLQEFSVLSSSTLGSLLDMFPVLSWLPNSFFPAAVQAQSFRERESKVLVKQWMKIKRQIQDGTAKVCDGDSSSLSTVEAY